MQPNPWGAVRLVGWSAAIPSGGLAWQWRLRGEQTAGGTHAPAMIVLGTRTAKMARVEAVLLVAGTAVPPRRLAQLATLADATEARTIVGKLNAVYEQWATPFRIERVAAGYRLFTLPQYALWLGKLHHREADLKLTTSALETLAVIAYRQPVTRSDVEAIRGVQCSEMIRQLMERGLVKIGGTDDALGRPFLFVTTPVFLETFGLRDLDELPLAERMRKSGGAVEQTANG